MTANSQPNVRVRTLLVSALALLGCSSLVRASSVGPELQGLGADPETGAEQVLHQQENLCIQVQTIGAGGNVSEQCSAPTADMPAAGHGGVSPAVDARQADAERANAGAVSSLERAPAPAGPAASVGCSTVSDGRTAARAFWAIVVIALLLAQSQRQRRRRPRGVTPSRRFRI